MRVSRAVHINSTEIGSIYCNMCGRAAERDMYGYYEEFLNVDKFWGYNSDFDGQHHSFDICPNCYKKIIEGFKIDLEAESSIAKSEAQAP